MNGFNNFNRNKRSLRRDSNSRPVDYKSTAQPLSYGGVNFMNLTFNAEINQKYLVTLKNFSDWIENKTRNSLNSVKFKI